MLELYNSTWLFLPGQLCLAERRNVSYCLVFSFLYVWLNLIEAHRLWWFWPFTVYSLSYSLHLNCNPRLLIASHTAVLQLLLIKVKPTSIRSNKDGKGWGEFLYLHIFSTSIMSCPKTSYKMRTKKIQWKKISYYSPFASNKKQKF